MVAQKLVKGLLGLCMVYVFVLVGANMVRYGQETGFSSDREMVSASLSRMTTDRHVEEDSFVYLTGVQKADNANDSYVVGVGDVLDSIWQVLSGLTESMTIAAGLGMGMSSLLEPWLSSLRTGLTGQGLLVSGYVLA